MEKVLKEEMIKRSIIESSKGIFQKYGFYKVTMDDIAKATKKARSTLYYYFKNKEDVFEAVIITEINEVLDKLEVSIAKEPKAADKFASFILKKYILIKSKANLYPILMGEMNSDEGISSCMRKIYIKRETALLKNIMIEGIAKKEFIHMPEEDVSFLAESFVLGFQGVERDLILENLTEDYTQKLKLLVKIMLKGLS